MKEDNILLGNISDKIRQCENQHRVTRSAFLDIRQQSLVEGLCKKEHPVNYRFYGGYEDAERKVILFFPNHMDMEDMAKMEGNPLAVINMNKKSSKELSHRDYLGSLLGLGIKRETLGDILVREDGTQVIVLAEIEEFILNHYEKAGRTELHLFSETVENIIVPPVKIVEKRDTVASLRLDNMIASAFSLSRAKASEGIAGGLVYINGLLCLKSDKLVQEGDKLVFRGKGKCLLKEVLGTSKKDRMIVLIHFFK